VTGSIFVISTCLRIANDNSMA